MGAALWTRSLLLEGRELLLDFGRTRHGAISSTLRQHAPIVSLRAVVIWMLFNFASAFAPAVRRWASDFRARLALRGDKADDQRQDLRCRCYDQEISGTCKAQNESTPCTLLDQLQGRIRRDYVALLASLRARPQRLSNLSRFCKTEADRGVPKSVLSRWSLQFKCSFDAGARLAFSEVHLVHDFIH